MPCQLKIQTFEAHCFSCGFSQTGFSDGQKARYEFRSCFLNFGWAVNKMTGCIVGNCTYGDMPIDETDWDDHILLNSNELVFVHVWCVKRYKQGKRRNDYINNLEQENTIMNDTVECPYCEHKNDMSEGTVELPSDNKFDHESEEFGEETREICKKDSIFPHPKHLKETSVCRSCWHKATCEEYLKS